MIEKRDRQLPAKYNVMTYETHSNGLELKARQRAKLIRTARHWQLHTLKSPTILTKKNKTPGTVAEASCFANFGNRNLAATLKKKLLKEASVLGL